MVNLVGPYNTGKAVGVDGAATINIDIKRLTGCVRGVGVKYNGDKPATADLIIKGKGTTSLTKPILTVTNGNTDSWFFPHEVIDGVDGAAVAGTYTPVYIDDVVNIELKESNTDDTVDVWFLLEN